MPPIYSRPFKPLEYYLWKRQEGEFHDAFFDMLFRQPYRKPDRRKGFKRENLNHLGEKRSRCNYFESPWWKMLQNDVESLKVPSSRESKMFRLGLRIGYPYPYPP